MIRRLALLAGLVAMSTGVCAANTTVFTARVLVPDGTSVADDFSAGNVKWFVFQADRGKSYLVEAIDTTSDQSSNSLSLALFEGDGTTSLDANESSICGRDRWAPGLNGQNSPGSDGDRCNAFLYANANPTPFITIQVTRGVSNGGYRIRVRENTIAGRWSTNGYNMFVGLQNLTAKVVYGFVLYYPTNAFSVTHLVLMESFTLDPYASVQFVQSSGTLSSGRGLCRVVILSGTDLNGQMYAYSPTANNFNVFTTEKPNHGGSNSW